jgi:hypothetical protein
MQTNIASQAIQANLEVLESDLETALTVVRDAIGDIKRGDRNMAVGGLSRAEGQIKTAPSIVEAIFAIHTRLERPDDRV